MSYQQRCACSYDLTCRDSSRAAKVNPYTDHCSNGAIREFALTRFSAVWLINRRRKMPSSEEQQVYEFILHEIDSVPHLEALLLLWNTRPNAWIAEDVGKRLYVKTSFAGALLRDLARQNFLTVSSDVPERFFYQSSGAERDRLIALLDSAYRHEVVRISTLIHSKASSAVLDFARAFRFTKERE